MPSINRSSRPEVFLRKSVLKICSKITGEHPCRSVYSIKLQSTLICWNHTSAWVFSCKFATYFQNTSGRLLLTKVWLLITPQLSNIKKWTISLTEADEASELVYQWCVSFAVEFCCNICGALCDLVAFLQFKKREKHPATLLKLTLLHGDFSRFLNCTNATKSLNEPHIHSYNFKADLKTERDFC